MRKLTILAVVLMSFAVTLSHGNFISHFSSGHSHGHGHGHVHGHGYHGSHGGVQVLGIWRHHPHHDDARDHDHKHEPVKAESNDHDDSHDKSGSHDKDSHPKSNLLKSIGHYHPKHPRHGCFKVARLLHCGLKHEEVKEKLVAILTTDSTQTLINFLNSLLSPKGKLIMKYAGLPVGTVEKLIQQLNGSPEDNAVAKNHLKMFAIKVKSFNFVQSLLVCQIIDIYETQVLRVQTKTQIHSVSTEDLKRALKKLEELEKHYDIKNIDFGKEHHTLEEKGEEGRPEVDENLVTWVDETDEWSLKKVTMVAATELQSPTTVHPPTTLTTLPPTTLTTQPPTIETTQPPTTETTQPPATETTQPPTMETTQPPTTETTTAEPTTLPPTTVPPTTLRPTAGPE